MRPLRTLGFLLALLTLTGSAAAQSLPSAGEFTPPADDPSLDLLRQIFGNLVDFVSGGASAADLAGNGTVMGAGFQIFNVAILFVGMLFVAYTTVMGVVNTAHDGEFLGRKMSDVWVPLRTFGGSALLLPLPGGFSFIQVIVMWLAVQSVGIGDKIWESMLTRIDQGGMIGHPIIPDARPLAANIFLFEVCRASMNQTYENAGRDTRIEVKSETDSINSTLPKQTGDGYDFVKVPVVNYYWRATGDYINPNVCGGLTWEESPQSQEGDAKYLDVSGITQAHTAAVNQMIATLRPVAEQIVAGQKPTAGAIEQVAYNYEMQLQSAARAAVDASNEASKDAFVDYAKEGGWVQAGAYYNHIIQLNDTVQLAVNAMPTANSIDIEIKEPEETLVGYRDAKAVADEFLQQRSESAQQAEDADVASDGDWNCAWKKGTNFDAIKRCLSKPALWGIEQMTQEMAGANTSHVAQVKSVGDTIMAAGWAMLGTFTLGNAAAKAVSDSILGEVGAGFISGLVEPLTGFVTLMVTALLGFGAVCAFYIPLIPFIAWITGVIKWVVSVTESLVAAPIFAAAHIHPDGDEAVGRAGPGYMILLSMILRPALMLFGLLAAIAVAQPIAHLVNTTFILAVKGAMHDSANGIGAFIAYCAIYMIIMTTVLHSVFALINWVPDSVFRFMGNAVGMHGVADREEHEAAGIYAGAWRSHAPRAMEAGGRTSRTGGGEPSAPKTGGASPSQQDLAQVPHGAPPPADSRD